MVTYLITLGKRKYTDILSVVEYMIQVTLILRSQKHYHVPNYSRDIGCLV